MLSYLGKPIVFLACVNSYIQGKRIRYLVQERKALAKIIREKKPFQYFKPIQKGNRPLSFFLEKISSLGLHRQVQILHLIGHVNEGKFKIESDDYESDLSFEELDEILAQLPRLRLIYLNGCATPELLDHLLKKDIPAIIATPTTERSSVINESAHSFYDLLGQGRSIWESFWRTSQEFEKLAMVPVTYDVEKDEIKCHKEPNKPIPWGMYYFEENLFKIQAPPKRRALFPISLKKESRDWKGENKFMGIRNLILATLIGLFAVGVSLYLFNPVNFFLILSNL